MSQAELSRTTIDTNSKGGKSEYTFRTIATITIFQGYGVVYSDKDSEEADEKENLYNFLQLVKENDGLHTR